MVEVDAWLLCGHDLLLDCLLVGVVDCGCVRYPVQHILCVRCYLCHELVPS